MEGPKLPENIQFPDIAEKINSMAKIDQDIRQKEIDDPEFWGGDIDKEHTEKIKEIIDEIGWPTISKVGEEASFNAWLLVQHADHDVPFQERCLELMKQESEGEVSKHDLAYLEDRVRINTGRLQVYGTQFKSVEDNNGIFEPKDIEDPDRVDERRKSMGLKTLAENVEEMYRKYNVPKPEN